MADIAGNVLNLAGLLEFQKGAVVSRQLVAKKAGTVTIFAFDAGEGLSEHTAPYDALIQVLDGAAEVTLGQNRHEVSGGEILLMPAKVPHALKALRPFKMLLTMIRSEE